FRVEADLDSFGPENLPDRVRDVRILAAYQPRGHLDYGHAAAKTAVHLSELESPVTASDDDQVFGEEVDVHQALVGQIGNLIHPRHTGYERPAAHVDEEAFAGQRLGTDADGVRVEEPRVPGVDRDVRERAQPALEARGRALNQRILSRLGAGHVRLHGPGDLHPILRGPLRQPCGVGARNQGLRRSTAVVEAGAAKFPALDDGHPHPSLGKAVGKRWARLSGADDDGVESVHVGTSPPETFARVNWPRRAAGPPPAWATQPAGSCLEAFVQRSLDLVPGNDVSRMPSVFGEASSP